MAQNTPCMLQTFLFAHASDFTLRTLTYYMLCNNISLPPFPELSCVAPDYAIVPMLTFKERFLLYRTVVLLVRSHSMSTCKVKPFYVGLHYLPTSDETAFPQIFSHEENGYLQHQKTIKSALSQCLRHRLYFAHGRFREKDSILQDCFSCILASCLESL